MLLFGTVQCQVAWSFQNKGQKNIHILAHNLWKWFQITEMVLIQNTISSFIH